MALRRLARQTRDADQARRLLALASIYDGGSRSEAARLGSGTVQIVLDWVVRFNERGPDGLINGKAPGGPAKLNDAQRQALAKTVESGRFPLCTVRWRRKDPVQWLFEEFRISPHDQRTMWADIFGAICPKKGKGAGLVMPRCDTDAMAAHLAEISVAVEPGAHAVLILDQAGWHVSGRLVVPEFLAQPRQASGGLALDGAGAAAEQVRGVALGEV